MTPHAVASFEWASLVVTLLAGLSAFVALSLVDPAAPPVPLRRWLRRLGCGLALALAALVFHLPGWNPEGDSLAPLAGLLLLAVGGLATALVLDQRQRSDRFYALGALPGALLLAAGQALLAGDGPAMALPGDAGWLVGSLILVIAMAMAMVVAGHFRRRRAGSPLQLSLAAAVLLALGLFAQQQMQGGLTTAVSGGWAQPLPALVLGVALLSLSVRLAADRWVNGRSSPGALRQGTRIEPVSGLPLVEVLGESFLRVLRLAVAGHGGCAVVVLDFAGLERVLATQGKSRRDSLFAAAAWRLRSARRDEELIAAMGEQRFVLVLRIAHPGEATDRVRELLASFEQPLGDGDARVRLRPSAGVSLWPEHAEDFPRLLADALVALERCPPGAMQLFHSAQREESEQRLQVENQLVRALGEGEIGLVLQPIIDALSGDVRMVELLARWNHPEFGNISPKQFILIAESSGAIAEFDRWLLKEAISTVKWLDAAGLPNIRVAMNCSPVNLVIPQFLEDFERCVLESGIDAARLEVEVTEAALAEGERAVIESLVRLRSLGVGLTIDDFGIGHSSLARLRDLPVDTLKIDQSFVRDMHHPKGEFLVSGILGLAHGLGKAVIAEGVETRAQRVTLTDLGCEYLQGFLISRPLSWRALLDFVGAEDASRSSSRPPAGPAENGA